MTAQQTATTPRPTSDDTPKIRRALKDGRTIQWCADAHGWPRHRIKALIDQTPGWLVDATRDTAHIFRDGGTETDHDDTEAKVIAMTPTEQEPLSNLETLIRRGEKSDSPRTRKAAERARSAVEELRTRISAEEVERRVRDEIAELEAKLAAAKQKLPGSATKTAKSSRPSTLPPGLVSKEVRAWATGAGLTCPANGRIPKNVVDAYVEAHEIKENA